MGQVESSLAEGLSLQSRCQPGMHCLKPCLGLEGLLLRRLTPLAVGAGWDASVLLHVASHPPGLLFSMWLFQRDSLDFFTWWLGSMREGEKDHT